MEERHEKRYRKLAANIEQDSVFNIAQEVEWKCNNCGSISQIVDLAIEDGGTSASSAADAFQILSPLTTKGDLLTSDGTSKGQRLPSGTQGQVLTVNLSKTQGLEWVSHPEQLLAKQIITESCTAIDFLQVFDASKFQHYKLCIQNNTRSPATTQMQFVLGASSREDSPWLTPASDYRWQAFDIRGKTTRTESTADIGECPYFPLGNSTTSYRACDGFFHAIIDIWNDGIAGHPVSMLATVNYMWFSGTTKDSGMGHYGGTYLNSIEVTIDSLRFQSATDGLITGGTYSLYGME